MSNNLRGWLRLLNIWIPALFGVGVIAVESTLMMGAAETSGPLRRIWEFLFGAASDVRWETIHHYIRKMGHVAGYGMISGLFFRAWYLSMPLRTRASRLRRSCVSALFCTLVLASSDEYHQSLIPGRTSSPRDVLIDMCGAFAVQLILLFFLSLLSDSSNEPSHWKDAPVLTPGR